MAEFIHSRGRKNRTGANNSERDTPPSSHSAAPATDGSRPPSRAGRLVARMGETFDKGKDKMERGFQKVERGFKTFMGMGGPTNHGEGETSAQDVVGPVGGLGRDGEASVVGGMGTVDTLAGRAAVGTTLSAEQVLGVPAELEADQEATSSSAQLHAASASAAKNERSALPETPLIPKHEDKVATTHGIKDALALIGGGSGAVSLGNNSLAAVEVTELDRWFEKLG